MHQKHEAPAVSAAASLIATAIIILQHSGESVGIGIRTEAERSLQRLGPDHKVKPFERDALRGFLREEYGEEFVTDVIDNNAPAPREPESELDKRFAALEERFQKRDDEQTQENARLRAELEALQKGAKKGDDKKTPPGSSTPST